MEFPKPIPDMKVLGHLEGKTVIFSGVFRPSSTWRLPSPCVRAPLAQDEKRSRSGSELGFIIITLGHSCCGN